MIALDTIDYEILRRLHANAETPTALLAGSCHCSVSTIQRRVRRLRASKALLEPRATIHPACSRHDITTVIEVTTRHCNAATRQKMAMLVRDSRHIKSSFALAGEIQYILICVFRNMREFTDFTELELVGSDWIEQFKSHFVMSQYKHEPLLDLGAQVD